MTTEEEIKLISEYVNREAEDYGLRCEIDWSDNDEAYRVGVFYDRQSDEIKTLYFRFVDDNLMITLNNAEEVAEGVGYSGRWVTNPKYFWMAFLDWPK